MIIGLCGGLCVGKKAVAQYLTECHGFQHVKVLTDEEAQDKSKWTTATKLEDSEVRKWVGENRCITFSSIESFQAHASKNWREKWVITDELDEEVLEVMCRRPYFLLIAIDAPVTLRWRRFKAEKADGEADTSFEDFVKQDDLHMYNRSNGITRILDKADLRIINSSATKEQLYEGLDSLNLLDEQRLRPNWDQYFMQLASLAAQRSNCMKRRVGCVLVRESRVISTGYNGTPRNLKNCNEGGCPRCNEGQKAGIGLATCLCIHAEENALLEAGRERIREGSVLYCDTCPCLTCSIKITQVGISEVVYSHSYSMDNETAAIFEEGGVKLRQFSPPQRGTVHIG